MGHPYETEEKSMTKDRKTIVLYGLCPVASKIGLRVYADTLQPVDPNWMNLFNGIDGRLIV